MKCLEAHVKLSLAELTTQTTDQSFDGKFNKCMTMTLKIKTIFRHNILTYDEGTSPYWVWLQKVK